MTRTTRPTRVLASQPDLDQLRRQAKELQAAFIAGDAGAAAEVHAHYRYADAATFGLHHAQLVIARAYGFDSWPRLKAHVDGLTSQQFISAARDNDIEKVGHMLKSRPDLVHAQWSYGDERRALHAAVMNNSPEMVRLLMGAGADATAGIHPHRDATTARKMAIERDLKDVLRVIEEEEHRRKPASGDTTTPITSPASISARQVGLETVVRAVARGDLEWLKARHAERPLANVIDWQAGGLLTLAAVRNQRDAISLLLDFGFDPDERTRWSEGPDAAYSQGYPLWHCAATGKAEIAELLLQRGADANVHVDSSGSPVYAAYSHRQQAMVDLLRRYGGVVTPDIVGLYRETRLAEDLLTGATKLPDGTVPDGRSLEEYLLEYALSGGAADIVRLALEKLDWPRGDSRWFRMLGRGVDFWNHIPWLESGRKEFDRTSYVEAFRLLVERCDANVVGGFGRTALHDVAAAGDHVTEAEAASLAEILLSAGARTNVRDELLESTPLGWACRWGRTEVARLLLHYGADADETGTAPWARPRAWATKMNRPGALALLSLVEPGEREL